MYKEDPEKQILSTLAVNAAKYYRAIVLSRNTLHKIWKRSDIKKNLRRNVKPTTEHAHTMQLKDKGERRWSMRLTPPPDVENKQKAVKRRKVWRVKINLSHV